MSTQEKGQRLPSAGHVNGGPERLIGRYVVLAQKAAGPLGSVYLGKEPTTGGPVALRLFPRAITDVPNVAEMLRRRARAVIEASRAHPALIRVLEYGTTEDDQLFAAMESAEGLTLKQFLSSRRNRDVTALLALAVKLGKPVETLHSLGFVHGGVRPANFIVGRDGTVKLLDIELIALPDAPGLRPLLIEHAPATYLAPEQIDGRPLSDRTDVYAFATLVQQMLSGPAPFETGRDDARGPQPNRPAPEGRGRKVMTSALEATLLSAMDKRPDHRPGLSSVLQRLVREARNRRLKHVRRLAAAVLVAAVVSAPVAWRLLVAPPTVPASANVPPAPPPKAIESPVPAVAAPAEPISPVSPPSPVAEPVADSAPVLGSIESSESSELAAIVPATTSAQPVLPPPVAVPAPAPPPVRKAPPPRVERRASRAPAADVKPSTTPRADDSSRRREADEPDATAVIDWLLKRQGAEPSSRSPR